MGAPTAEEVQIVYGGGAGYAPDLGGCDGGGLGFYLRRGDRECGGGRARDLGLGDGTTFRGRVADDHVPRDSVRFFSWNLETETLTYAAAGAREIISLAVCGGRIPDAVVEALVAVKKTNN